MTSRREVEERVDELAEQHSGQAFADAVRAYSDELNADERLQLQEVLVERGANLDQAVMDRVDARGWLRRQWDKAGRPPRRSERDDV